MTDPLAASPARAEPARAARRVRLAAAALLGAAALATPLIGLTAGLYTDVEQVRSGITAGTWQTPTPTPTATPTASEDPTEPDPGATTP